MKKITIALVCMLLTAGAAMAQKKFTFGPKVAVDYTHFWGQYVKHDGLFNYQAGLFMEYRFTDKISIAPEAVFAAQGGKFEMTFEGDVKKYTYNLNYINIPVMFKYYIIPALSVDLGPQLGVNVYSKVTSKIKGSGSAESKNTTDNKDNTKTIDVGVGLGFTYNITEDVFVQGRYTLGLTKAFNYGDAYGLDYKNRKNGNAQIAIGYRF